MPGVAADDDLYAVLSVSPRASDREIERGYRDQMRRWHPDVCKAPGAERRAKAINYARDILRSPATRTEYDRLRGSKLESQWSTESGHEYESPIDRYDLNLRSWSARIFVWTAKLGWPWSLPFLLLQGLIDLVLEWFDVAVVGFRFAFSLRPWPKAAYWIVWEVAALTSVVGILTTGKLVPSSVLGPAVWALLLMPPAYFLLRAALRTLLRRTGRTRDRRRSLTRRD
jgi:hypothetical protein